MGVGCGQTHLLQPARATTCTPGRNFRREEFPASETRSQERREGAASPPDPPASGGSRTRPAQDHAFCALGHLRVEKLLAQAKSFHLKGSLVFLTEKPHPPVSPPGSGLGGVPPSSAGQARGVGGGGWELSRQPLRRPSPHPSSGRSLNAQDPNLPSGSSGSAKACAGGPGPSAPQIPASLLRPPPPAPAPSCRCRTGTREDTTASGAPGPRRSRSRRASPCPRGRLAWPVARQPPGHTCALTGAGRAILPAGARGTQALQVNPRPAGVCGLFPPGRETKTLTQAGTTWVFDSDPFAPAAAKWDNSTLPTTTRGRNCCSS